MTQPLESPVSELDLSAKIKLENLRMLSSYGVSSLFVSVVIAAIVYITLAEVTDTLLLQQWVFVVVILAAFRTLMIVIFNRMPEDSKRFNLWTAVYLLFIYASAACWGVLPLSNVFFIADWTETFIVFVVTGLSAGGVVSLFPILRACIPYLLLCLVPLIYVLGASGEPGHTAMAVFASLYLILLIRSAYSLNRTSRNSIRLEMENTELFKFLLKARN